MDLLLDKNELIWAAGLSLALVYFVATYVRLRYCERRVTEYGRLILRPMGAICMWFRSPSCAITGRMSGAYLAVRGGGRFCFLSSVQGRACCRFRQLCGLPAWGFRSAGVLCLGRIVHPAAGLKRYCYAWSMRFNEAPVMNFAMKKDLDRLHRDEYLRMLE